MTKLSISMITYNHERYIGAALDSILSQEVNVDYEIVIGEDYSKDRTREIIENYIVKFPGMIRLIDRGKNVGSTKNFYDTVLQCKGEYIAMMDGDDLMLPGKLQKQVDYLDQHPECSMVAHSLIEFEDVTDVEIREVKPKGIKEFYTIKDLLKHGSIFGNSSKMFRRSAIPFKDSDQKINFIADMYLTVLVTGNAKIGWIPEVLGKYRRHAGAMMRNLIAEKAYQDELYTLNGISNYYGKTYENYYGPRLAYANLIYGIDELNNGNYASARKKFLKSISSDYTYSFSTYFYLIMSFAPKKIRDYIIKIKRKNS